MQQHYHIIIPKTKQLQCIQVFSDKTSSICIVGTCLVGTLFLSNHGQSSSCIAQSLHSHTCSSICRVKWLPVLPHSVCLRVLVLVKQGEDTKATSGEQSNVQLEPSRGLQHDRMHHIRSGAYATGSMQVTGSNLRFAEAKVFQVFAAATVAG